MNRWSDVQLRQAVRTRYGQVALSPEGDCGCAPTGCCGTGESDRPEAVALALGYGRDDLSAVPEGANMGLGCGNPGAIAAIRPGERVLDLGSGGGFDCFLAARAVGERGEVIGVDMSPEMIEKARQNLKKTGLSNVSFRLGEIENLPVADASVDVILSNCVINLSPQKEAVFREAFRVLRPAGRLAISDMLAASEAPEALMDDLARYTACMTGAATIEVIEAILQRVGFDKIRIKFKDEGKGLAKRADRGLEYAVASARIEALKPGI